MTELFFIASKTLGMLARLESWLLILLALALLAGFMGWRRAAMGLTGAVLAVLSAVTAWPLGNLLLRPLENTYPPQPALPAKVTGIIVLGGAEDIHAFDRWGMFGLNDAGERLTAGVELARRYPNAKLIFTGGAASLVYNDNHSAPSAMTRNFWVAMGVPQAQIVVEDASRNTSENAGFTKELVQPKPGDTWVLVTSAFHMRRSAETFARAGWTGIIPWPVDYRSSEQTFRVEWKLGEHLMDIDMALKEYLGLWMYRVVGK